MPKNILITGGSGQLGFTLYSDFKESYEVINTSKINLSDSISLDITNASEVEKKLNMYSPDMIFNCASYNQVDSCELNKKDARDVIVLGLQNLINNSKKNCKIVHISSDYIFDGQKGSYSESDSPNPINYYGKLKLESENLLRSSNRDFIILRCSTVFSGLLDNKSNFLAWVYKNLKAGNKIRVVDDQLSNPTPVELISKVLNLAILLNSRGIYNIGSLDSISRYEFALKICNKFGFNSSLIKKIQTNSLKQVAERPKNTYLKIDKILEELDVDIYSLDYYLDNIKERSYE